MRRWELTIALDPARGQPLFLQLAGAIADDIQRGRLKPGEALPGSRELAECLGINRNTVIAGYGELAAEGLISTRIGGGTFVAESVIAPFAAHAPSAECPTYPLTPPVYRVPPISTPVPGALNISSGMPDVRLFPAAAMARAFRRAIGQRGRASLNCADPCGHPRLRRELAAMLARTRGLPVTPENLLITHSIEQAIDLVARMLLRPGDVVVVEAFGYPPAWSVLKLAGARLVPLPLDEDGLSVNALEALLAQQQVRAVFLTPHHQFPTAVVMSHAKRMRLAELAMRHGFAIIEDDYDHEFHYSGKPILPIASGAGRANVIYLGSLSNLLAPGTSTGFVIAPAPVFERLASLRAASDAQGDAAMECAIAELFEDGELLRHARRMRCIYAARRDAWRRLWYVTSAAPSRSASLPAAWGYGCVWTMRSTWQPGPSPGSAKACSSSARGATSSSSASNRSCGSASAITMKPSWARLCSAWHARSRSREAIPSDRRVMRPSRPPRPYCVGSTTNAR
jgi:GntR family transcriptional regulator/MocR family aminotransferase